MRLDKLEIDTSMQLKKLIDENNETKRTLEDRLFVFEQNVR